MNRKNRIAIVTDSTADIPTTELERLQIRVVPALITLNGQTLIDGVDISREDFYRQLAHTHAIPSTAAPAPFAFSQLYTEILAAGYEQILSIHVAGKLSSILSIAKQAAAEFHGQVTVFDSGQLSLGLGFQVLEAASAAIYGSTLTHIISILKNMQPRIRIIAMVNKLDALKRSGRVNWLYANIGEWLNVKLIISLADSKVQRLGMVRTRRKAFLNLHQRVEQWPALERLAVIYAGIPAEARVFLRRITRFASHPTMLVEATTAIGVHLGEGSIGVAAVIHSNSY